MDKPVRILVLATKLFGLFLNPWFAGDEIKHTKLGKQRVSMSYGFPRDSCGSILPGQVFDLIIVEICKLDEDLAVVKQAQQLYPNAKVIFCVSIPEMKNKDLFALAKEYSAQIEFDTLAMAEKVRRFFFSEDFKEAEDSA